MVLVVTPVARHWDGSTVSGPAAELKVVVQPVNDPPAVKGGKPAALPLVPFDIKDNEGMMASEMAGKKRRVNFGPTSSSCESLWFMVRVLFT